MNKQKRTEIFTRLRRENPHPTTELKYGNAFQLLVAVVLYVVEDIQRFPPSILGKITTFMHVTTIGLVLLWTLAAVLAVLLVLLIVPIHVRAEGGIHGMSLSGQAAIRWGWGLVSVFAYRAEAALTRVPTLVHRAGALVVAGLAACDKTGPPPVDKLTYADNVQPILQRHCAACHVPGQQGAEESGFLVDSYASVMEGTRHGPVVEPGSARNSPLYLLVSGKERLVVKMPHGKDSLAPVEIETIRAWIDEGAIAYFGPETGGVVAG